MKDARIVGQVYPWDVADDPGRPSALLGAGIPEVAMASQYHAVRAVRWGADGAPEVVSHTRSSSYLPIDRAAWSGMRLVPGEAAGKDAGSFLRASVRAEREGLGVRAWIVLTHDDERLAIQHPELATVDAWGNRSRFALCAAQPDVAAYCRMLVEQTVRQAGLRKLFVESVASPGFAHSVSHDKSAFAGLSSLDVRLMSLCFCAACHFRADEDGWDLDELAALVPVAIGADMTSPDTRLGELLAHQATTRARVSLALCESLAVPVEREPIELTVAATTDLAGFTAFAPLAAVPSGVASLCASLGTDGAGARDLAAWAEISELRRSAVLTLGPPGESLARAWDRAAVATAVDELYLYLVGNRRPDTLGVLDLSRLVTSHPTAS